uniref:Uncharacterized protein n=1 Tax=Quercus lobata TaxID=97700 RepID=A0A7N2RCE8_QUELO
MVEFLFEDIFRIERLNPDGKKFDKVIRVEAKSEKFDMFMHLDVMVTKDFEVKEGDKFAMVIAPTLNLDGTPDTGYYTPSNTYSTVNDTLSCGGCMGKCLNGVKLGEMSLSCAMETTTCVINKVKVVQGSRQSLADRFDYVMYGKLYKIADGSGRGIKAEINVSFGGLLMMLRGDPSHCNKFELDQRLYVLMRKV